MLRDLTTKEICTSNICLFFILEIIQNIIVNFGVILVAIDLILLRQQKSSCQLYTIESRCQLPLDYEIYIPLNDTARKLDNLLRSSLWQIKAKCFC